MIVVMIPWQTTRRQSCPWKRVLAGIQLLHTLAILKTQIYVYLSFDQYIETHTNIGKNCNCNDVCDAVILKQNVFCNSIFCRN